MGVYSENIKRTQHAGLTAQQIRAAKCMRSKARNVLYRAERRRAAEKRQAAWKELTRREKLAELAQRPGECKRQLSRIRAMAA